MADWVSKIENSFLDNQDYLIRYNDDVWDITKSLKSLFGEAEKKGRVRVYIWKTDYSSPFKSRRNEKVNSSSSVSRNRFIDMNWGHVASEILHPEYGSKAPLLYMSYWPENKVSNQCILSLEEDKDRCKNPDCIIEIDNMYHGRMALTWYDYLDQEFHDLNRNCCTVTSNVLRAGSATDEWNVRAFKKALRATEILDESILDFYKDLLRDKTVWSPGRIESAAEYMMKILGGRKIDS